MFCQLLNFALNENIFRKLTKFCMIKWCPRQIFLLLQNWKSNEIDYNLPSLCILCPNFFPSGYTSSPHSLNHHSLLMMCWGRSCGSLSWKDNFFITMQKSHQTFYLKHFSNSSLSEWFFNQSPQFVMKDRTQSICYSTYELIEFIQLTCF